MIRCGAASIHPNIHLILNSHYLHYCKGAFFKQNSPICSNYLLAISLDFVYTLGSCGRKWDELGRNAGNSGVLHIKGQLEQMFLGFDRHNLDNKNRLTVPAKYRVELETGGYVMRGFDDNLMVLTTQAFDVLSKRLNHMSITNPKARLLKRKIFASAERFELDKTGRFLIPEHLRLAASLENEVVLSGLGDFFEIWSPELWGEQEAQAEAQAMDPELFDDLDLTASD